MQATSENIELLNRFVHYCLEHLKMKNLLPEVNIVLMEEQTTEQPTAGFFDPESKEIHVCIKNRAMADCMRTIAHELTHLKQLVVDDVDFPEDDLSLQIFEDEANYQAGRFVRFFGRKNREIYDDIR